MCGIIGFIGNDALNGILNGLELLEYRGYDSAGIAVSHSGAKAAAESGISEPARASRRFTNARDVSKTCGRFLRKPVTIPVASVIQGGRPMAACLIQMRIHIVWEK